ncbi:MAG TPA: hypothetical protein VH684_22060 [Xanthobacteraceae bacterium]
MKAFCSCPMRLSFTLAIAAYFAGALVAKAAPDISGTYWATTYSPKIQVLGGGEPPLTAAGKAAYEANQAGLKDGSIIDTARHVCLPDGVPRVLATPYPFEIFQVPVDQVTFVYEMNHQARVILLDRPLPKVDSLAGDPRYNGHSVGHWEGDTLVVETIDFPYMTFLDSTGLPHTEEMTTIERIRKIGNEIEDVITIHDPKMYSRDWQARFAYQERNDVRLEDYACNDRHRDLSGVKGTEPRSSR